MAKFEIIRQFTGARGVIRRGAVVTDPDWRNLGSLIRTGYVREVVETDPPAETPAVIESPPAKPKPATKKSGAKP